MKRKVHPDRNAKVPASSDCLDAAVLSAGSDHSISPRPVGRPSTPGGRGGREEKTITKRDTKADFIHLATPEVNLFPPPLYSRIASELIHNGVADPRVLGGPAGANRELKEAKVDREETEMPPWRSRQQN